MSSTALSVSVTRSEAASSSISRIPPLNLIPCTILLRVYRARICRCDHITSFQGYAEEKIMDLLEIGLGHCYEESSFSDWSGGGSQLAM